MEYKYSYIKYINENDENKALKEINKNHLGKAQENTNKNFMFTYINV